jgi:hypothetical protein
MDIKPEFRITPFIVKNLFDREVFLKPPSILFTEQPL